MLSGEGLRPIEAPDIFHETDWRKQFQSVQISVLDADLRSASEIWTDWENCYVFLMCTMCTLFELSRVKVCTERVMCSFQSTSALFLKSKIQTSTLSTVFLAEFYSTFILSLTVRHPQSGVHNPPKSVHPTRKVCTCVHSVHSVLRATHRYWPCTFPPECWPSVSTRIGWNVPSVPAQTPWQQHLDTWSRTSQWWRKWVQVLSLLCCKVGGIYFSFEAKYVTFCH